MTGADDATGCWQRFFGKDDVVGIKVNPVGSSKDVQQSPLGRSISSPEVLLEVVQGLKSAGVQPQNIIVFERYADEFRDAGYEAMLRERAMDGVRWYASAGDYSDSRSTSRASTTAQGPSPSATRTSSATTPTSSSTMGFCRRPHAGREGRPPLPLAPVGDRVADGQQDHHPARAEGPPLGRRDAGAEEHVARHEQQRRPQPPRAASTSADSPAARSVGPNQCNTFIPTAAGQTADSPEGDVAHPRRPDRRLRGRARDAGTDLGHLAATGLFFATDPVAMDHVGWDIIDAKRAQEGWLPVAQMGRFFSESRAQEQFNRRQPEHVILAGTVGMGLFERAGIEHRRMEL